MKGTVQEIVLLEDLLETMDLPDSRKIVNEDNARWLLRNIAINNKGSNVERAISLLKRTLVQ